MPPRLGAIVQMLLMAAIVTTALFVPVGALLALACHAALRMPLESLVSFGGRLAPVAGLLAWWAILLVPALVYSACVMPWHAHDSSPDRS
jgi:hypothetical protein